MSWPAVLGVSGRTSYSFLRARRTDPDVGVVARSPFDITHTLSTVLQRSFAQGMQASIAFRSATGRPVTPIIDAHYDAQRQLWRPLYGTPFSERLPVFRRVDVSVSRLIPLPHERLLIAFVAANNILDRRNTYAYRYSDDYSERATVRSQFRRSIYFGATLNF